MYVPKRERERERESKSESESERERDRKRKRESVRENISAGDYISKPPGLK